MAIQNALRSGGLDFIAKILDFTIAGSVALVKLEPNPIMLPIIWGISAVWIFVYSMIADRLINSRDVL